MEFLYKLYESEYFGIGLFIVITILTFLFLVILFFGKKDEKVRKLEETKKLELEAENTFKQTNESVEDLSIPVIEQPQEEAVLKEENVNTPVFEEPKQEQKEEANLAGIDLAAFNQEVENSLNEPTNLENIEEKTNNVEEPKMEEIPQEKSVDDIDINNLFQTNIEPVQEESAMPIEKEYEEPKKEMDLPKTEAPFSSVYVNKEEDITPVQQVKEEEKQEFELPKMVEMPKLNEEKIDQKEETKVEEKVEKEEKPISDFDSLFGSIEKETFDIEK